MRLKRLELFGFKSFADRTVFEFGDQTLTGVVGPNGCGKSNVVDSVRWVLGEQRPTSMRGSEMTDVIFKGSTSRPPLSVAEVTLVLDNASGRLDGRGPEVAITRRVFQSGEGEYLLDGDAVRLKDVREMLFDTGLGSRGYSVLEQGRIDAVLSANPLERRRIFEEAAGVSRYRQRKAEAELRLAKVADDMARLDDLLGELGTRVRSLRIQAGKAERYVAARDEWAREKTRLYRHRLSSSGRELAALEAVLRGIETSLSRARVERAHLEDSALALERERHVLLAEIERQASESSRLAGDGRALDERRAHLSTRAGGLEQDAREEEERAGRLDATLAERAAERARLEEERCALAAEVERLSGSAEELALALAASERAAQERKADLERSRSAGLTRLAELSQAENRARSLGEARDLSRARAERAQARCDAARTARSQLAGESEALEAEARATEEVRARDEGARRDLEQRLADLAEELRQLEAKRAGAEVERAKLSSRIEFLLDRERDLEELSKAVRAVVESAGTDAGPCRPEELLGLVADHLRTDTRHARALDAALSARGRALVARDLEAARRVSAWVKARESGGIGLLLGAGLAPSAAGEPHPADPRIAGRLLDHVRCTEGCAGLAEILVGDVCLAQDLEAAIELAQIHPGLRFATLEGDLADAAGLLAGSGALTQGAVGRRSSAAELEVDLERLSDSILRLDQARGEILERSAALEKERDLLAARLEEAARARAAAETRLATSRARLADLELDRSALERESRGALEEVAGIERDLSAEEARRAELSHQNDAARAELSRLEREVEACDADLEGTRVAASEARVEAARARERLDGVEQRASDLDSVLSESRAELARARALAEEHVREAAEARAGIEEAARASARVLEERARIEERLRELRDRDERERESVRAARAGVDRLQRELEETSAALSEKRLEEQRLSLSRQEIVRRAAEELTLDEPALVSGFDPEPELSGEDAPRLLGELERRVGELKERLEKIGPVNMEALAELQDVGGRLEFLQKQRDDLTRARDALSLTLRTIDVESKRLFLETFEAVRTNFQRIFRQLFGGGRADVALEEGADVLDAGVEIVARPPGRELLPIGLLSGGQRTLTALALLFAVFEARPSPFCILDEVDAALDDANVERFLAMLDGFRRSTQFVVVTHNKGTMAACQGLYGVTMETKGVSRHVAVQLDEVDRFTQRAPDRRTSDRPVEDGRPPDVDADTGERLVEIVPQAKAVPETEEARTEDAPSRVSGVLD